MVALDERRGPRAVHVPDQDSHDRSSDRGASISTAPATSAAVTSDRHGWPGTGQLTARLSRHGADWSPSSTDGTRYGAQRAAGTTGANSDTTGVPHRRGEVGGPGVGDHHGVGRGEHGGQFGQIGAPDQIDHVVTGGGAMSVAFAGPAGDDDAPPSARSVR